MCPPKCWRMEIERTALFDRVYASLLAGAIGDAMGGAVEGLEATEIAARFGRVETFLPYDRAPSFHGAFGAAPGLYTDDTRLRLLLCRAIIDAGDLPSRGELSRAIVAAYHAAPTDLERGFYEEYALKAMHGSEKLVFSGEMTNGAIMMNAPVGLVSAGAPDEAFAAGYELAFLTDGYAKHSAAAMAAAVAAAMLPTATVDGVVDAVLATLAAHRARVEGPLHRSWPKRYLPNEQAVERAVEIARSTRDVFALPDKLYDVLRRGPLFSEASQTLAVPLAMAVAAGGDLRLATLGCVNYGRDNDSYASVVGGLLGAMHGTVAIPSGWIEPVLAANPAPDMREIAVSLCRVIAKRHDRRRASVAAVDALMMPGAR